MVDSSARAAFVITSHADIPQLSRLVRRLLAGGPDVRVYISHDAAGEPGVESLAGLRCTVIREKGGRGDFTQIQRLISLFRLVEDDGGADYVTVLSGMDYPSRPVPDFLNTLPQTGDGFLHHFPVFDAEHSDWSQREGKQRYRYCWRSLWPLSASARNRWHWLHGLNFLQPFMRVNVAYGSVRVGLRRRAMPVGLDIHGGSAWFTISRRAVQYFLTVVDSRPDIVDWGRTSLAIDEAFMQSILLTARRFNFVNWNARFIDFQDDAFGHPRVLTSEDVELIVESGAYFVRKVDRTRSAELLSRLDEMMSRSDTA